MNTVRKLRAERFDSTQTMMFYIFPDLGGGKIGPTTVVPDMLKKTVCILIARPCLASWFGIDAIRKNSSNQLTQLIEG